jgi:hypothetical protein
MKKHNVQLNLIAIWITLIFSSTFTLITWCNRPKDIDNLSVGIYETPKISKVGNKNALSIESRFSNNGSKSCFVSKLVIFIPFYTT